MTLVRSYRADPEGDTAVLSDETSRGLASGGVESLYDKPVFGKLRVVAVMLICFYAHHN
jgi:hypothetical protein